MTISTIRFACFCTGLAKADYLCAPMKWLVLSKTKCAISLSCRASRRNMGYDLTEERQVASLNDLMDEAISALVHEWGRFNAEEPREHDPAKSEVLR